MTTINRDEVRFDGDDFARRMLAGAKFPAQFSPTAFYHPQGDSIEFFAAPDVFYAERVDDIVTVYYSEQTGEVVGSFIKGVKALCDRLTKTLPSFKIEIQAGKVRLEHLFLATLWASESPNSSTVRTYRKLAKVAESLEASTELAGAC